MKHWEKTFEIGRTQVGQSQRTYFIAEIGSNHNGSLDEALRYVSEAKEAGADAVKFQSFSAAGLLSPKRPKNGSKTDWEEHPAYKIIDGLELPDDWHRSLKKECDKLGIHFLSAPFEIGKARLLKEIGCPAIKIASGEITHDALLREVGSYGIPVILSTGTATMGEVEHASEVLWNAGCRKLFVLHCVSNYPPKFEEMNIPVIRTMADTLSVPVGLSDHTPGATLPILALGFGSRMVEKHVTFSRQQKGPDHPYAMEWPEFAAMIREIRNAEAALGDGIKRAPEGEAGERIYARKGLYAVKDLAPGEILTEANTKLVRHAFGIPANQANLAYGIPLQRPCKKDEAIFWEHLRKG